MQLVFMLGEEWVRHLRTLHDTLNCSTLLVHGYMGARTLGATLGVPSACAMRLFAPLALVASFVDATNDAPIIGVLTVPSATGCETARAVGAGRASGTYGTSCFASLYVKFIEAAGGRVVPLLYDWSDEELSKVFKSVNGVLFTGGGVDIANQSTEEAKQYLHAASVLFNLTIDSVEHVPLWGTCMGLQTLSILGAGSGRVLETYAFDSEDESLPLKLTEAAAHSQLFGQMPQHLKQWVTTENLTSNLHHDGVPPKEFVKNQRLGEMFSVLSTNVDRHGKAFASAIEGRRSPIFGVQFHPERPLFSWSEGEGINHGAHAIEVMQYFANFFMSQARRNSQKFNSKEEEDASLIYNYVPIGRSSYQCYTFQTGSGQRERTAPFPPAAMLV